MVYMYPLSDNILFYTLCYLNKHRGDTNAAGLFFLTCHQPICNICGSLILAGSYEELPGSNFLIQDGFESVIAALRKTVPSDIIYLNHQVKTIHWDNSNKLVQVDCENDRIFTADHVIVTVSLGFLKAEHHTLFDPKLPVEKVRSIERLGFGYVDKILLEFEDDINKEAKEKHRRIDLLWDEENTEVDRSNINEYWFRQINSFEMLSPRIIQGESCIHVIVMTRLISAPKSVVRSITEGTFKPVLSVISATSW